MQRIIFPFTYLLLSCQDNISRNRALKSSADIDFLGGRWNERLQHFQYIQ